MNLKNFFKLALSMILVLSCSVVMAQDETGTTKVKQKKEEKSSSIGLSGKMYLNWHVNMTDSVKVDSDGDGYKETTNEGDKKNTFEIERIYLTWKHKFNDIYSAKITTDISNDTILEKISDSTTTLASTETVTSKTGSTTSNYRLYVKYAYLQVKQPIGPLSLQCKFGMIPTTMIGFIDKLADQRFAYKNMLDDSKHILPSGDSLSPSADLGASIGLKAMKMITLKLALTNGEGYKKTLESSLGDSAEGKAYEGRLTITPIKSLLISAYYRNEGTGVDESRNYERFYGAGVAWKDKVIKIGANYLIPSSKVAGSKPRWDPDPIEVAINPLATGNTYNMYLIDAWVTINFDSIIQLPIFFMSRIGVGDDKDESDKKITFMGSGIGYKFNKYVRTIVWYQQFDNEAEDKANNPNPEKAFYVKAEVKI